MASLPYMQLYVSDYLADTAHLTAQQHGAYMLLLMNYWQKGRPLENTNERLQYVARLTPEEWNDNKAILAEFFIVEGDLWTHARIEDDLAKVREKSTKASTAGKRSFSVRSTPVEHSFNHKDKDIDKDKETTFDKFWDIYPRKVGKQEAARAFIKALRLADPEVILAGAKRYAEDKNRLAVYTAHPSTWLNQGRWEDEPIPSRTTEGVPTWVPPRFDHAEEENRKAKAVPPPSGLKELFNRIP
jgi:uncharacterized protein YdaU (DUF1376 family)